MHCNTQDQRTNKLYINVQPDMFPFISMDGIDFEFITIAICGCLEDSLQSFCILFLKSFQSNALKQISFSPSKHMKKALRM